MPNGVTTPGDLRQLVSGGGLLSSKKSSTAKTTTPASAGPIYAPATTFPQYTSGSWANLPTGTLGGPPPAPPTPTATYGNLIQFGGDRGLGGRQGYQIAPDALLSSLPQTIQTAIGQRWGLFGGGAPLPTTWEPFYQADRAYRHSRGNPDVVRMRV